MLAERASKVANAGSEQDFIEQMKQFDGDDDASLMPFMASMMETFLSKDMMYPPVKEMVEKYPKYLSDNRDKLDAQTLKRYEKQMDILRQIRDEYENEVDVDDQDASMKRFDNITNLMQQMQQCGYPPEELIGTLPAGWSFDALTGLPKLEDVDQASQSTCTIM
jgi:peroxin-19